MALALVAASAPAQATRSVFITHAQAVDAFWSVVKNGVDDAAELMGVEVLAEPVAARASTRRRRPSTWWRWRS